MNRYNFLRILLLGAAVAAWATWALLDVAEGDAARGVMFGAGTSALTACLWVLIGIAERRARWRRFTRNEPNAAERRYMERERATARRRKAETFADSFTGHQPRATPGERVPPQGGSGIAPSPFDRGGVVKVSHAEGFDRHMSQTVHLLTCGMSPAELMGAALTLDRLSKRCSYYAEERAKSEPAKEPPPA